MDSCAELNLTLLGLDGSNSRAFEGAARVVLSGLGAMQTMKNMFHLIVNCFHLVQMLFMQNPPVVLNPKKYQLYNKARCFNLRTYAAEMVPGIHPPSRL